MDKTHGIGKPYAVQIFLPILFQGIFNSLVYFFEINGTVYFFEINGTVYFFEINGTVYFFEINGTVYFFEINGTVYFFEINGTEKEGFPSCFQRKHDHFKSYKGIFNVVERRFFFSGIKNRVGSPHIVFILRAQKSY